jgi:hypothetical protein
MVSTREDYSEAARTLTVLPTPWMEPADIANAHCSFSGFEIGTGSELLAPWTT